MTVPPPFGSVVVPSRSKRSSDAEALACGFWAGLALTRAIVLARRVLRVKCIFGGLWTERIDYGCRILAQFLMLESLYW